jgi:transcriptional regulator with XRE-family HTH domain
MTTPTARPSRRVPLKPGALRRARESAGLTISALAAQAKVTPSHLASVERGYPYGASPPTLARIAAVLGVTIAELRQDDVPTEAGTDPQP